MSSDTEELFPFTRENPEVLDELIEASEQRGNELFAQACRQAKQMIQSEEDSA